MKYIALGSNGSYARQVVWGLEVPGIRAAPQGRSRSSSRSKMKVGFFSSCNCLSLNLVTGQEIVPNTVANATKMIVLATKIQKLVAKLATRALWVLYILP